MSRKGKNLEVLDGLDNFDPRKQDHAKLSQLTHLAMYVDGMQALSLISYLNDSDDPTTVNKLDCFGRAPLHWIVGQDYEPGCELLLDNSADINVRTNKEGLTPLMIACRKEGSAKMAQFLLKRGADHSIRAKSSATAFHIAVASGNRNCMRILILYGADPYLLMKGGKSALDHAKDEKLKTLTYSCFRSALIHKEKKGESCAECGSDSNYLFRCGKCYSAFYCSGHCQIEHWKSGHRLNCPGSVVATLIVDPKKSQTDKAFLIRLYSTTDNDLIAESEEKSVCAKVADRSKVKHLNGSSPSYHWARFNLESKNELFVYFSKSLPILK